MATRRLTEADLRRNVEERLLWGTPLPALLLAKGSMQGPYYPPSTFNRGAQFVRCIFRQLLDAATTRRARWMK